MPQAPTRANLPFFLRAGWEDAVLQNTASELVQATEFLNAKAALGRKSPPADASPCRQPGFPLAACGRTRAGAAVTFMGRRIRSNWGCAVGSGAPASFVFSLPFVAHLASFAGEEGQRIILVIFYSHRACVLLPAVIHPEPKPQTLQIMFSDPISLGWGGSRSLGEQQLTEDGSVPLPKAPLLV